MTQVVRYWVGEAEFERQLPAAENFVAPGIVWGEHWRPFTPAYWISQVWMNGLDDKPHAPYHGHGSLAEEIAFCLLSGYGVTAELATAAYDACAQAGLIRSLNTDANDWCEVLKSPLVLAGRTALYRYPNQKSKYLADAMKKISEGHIDTSGGKILRDSLMRINGIGAKTAGFIARNFLDSDEVAILDIHILRAGLLCGFFQPEQKVETQYFEMEAQYIEFCRAIRVRPAVLDCVIWDQMRTLGRFALDAIKCKFDPSYVVPKPRPLHHQLALSLEPAT
ncbi:hypothetical protein ACQKFX_07750 [Cupriavidus metallidurans]|uniref:8-oxoguanine DNA glycosylase n=1 Tax=Cupriavidus metallidurans TaxID=119219 RepID=UPI003D041AA3